MPLALQLMASDAPDLSSFDTIAFAAFGTDDGVVIGSRTDDERFPELFDEAFLARHRFEGKPGQVVIVSQSQQGPIVVAVGCGRGDDQESWRQAGAALARHAVGSRALFVIPILDDLGVVMLSEAVGTGAVLATYTFEHRSESAKQGLEELVISTGQGGKSEVQSGIDAAVATGTAVAFARDLVNEHPSSMTPTKLASDAAMFLESHGITTEVWELDKIVSERLGGLLGVARGSVEDPRLVVACYEPEGTPTAHVVLVGKGVTFDSGGLSLKTAQGMTTMKTDMTGAAVVLSTLSACRALGVAAKVTAIAPMTENMPSGSAIKPGDVLVARNGKTIEVLNTDAEGRLILADGLVLATEEEPDIVIDVATLTGAAVVALGSGMAALLSNDDELARQVLEAGAEAGEPLWRLPLVKEYESHIKSEVADIKNVGAAGEAGTISAALFLQHFVNKVPWVHLDIAGPARSEKSSGYQVKGGTAFGLRTLLDYLRSL
jgi:leucyl aminopeptidase